MSEKEKSPQKITPNPDGYDITIYPEYWACIIIMLVIIVLIYALGSILKPLFSSMNKWLFMGVFCALLFILAYGLLFCVSKMIGAKVNIRLTDEGLEQRKVSGPAWIPESKVVKWENMSYFHLFGIRGGFSRSAAFNGNDFFIGTKLGSDYSFSTIAFFRRERELKMVMKSFRTEFLQLARQHGIERKKLWEEKQDSFDKKHL